jgi:hypothetical protein
VRIKIKGSKVTNGGGWKTSFLIVCTAAQSSNFTLKVWSDSGAALTLPLQSLFVSILRDRQGDF